MTSKLPSHIEDIQGKRYCLLIGELDKKDFQDQCKVCSVKDSCTILQEFHKKVAGDWHAENSSGFFSESWVNEHDKYARKEMRGVSKVCGLALLYGGTSYTLSDNMKCTQDVAQGRIDSFFSKLNILSQYMDIAKRRVLESGQVYNLFGRRRDMTRWVFSKAASSKQRRRDLGYAERTGLNHPIQSTAAEVLKILMVRVDEYITNNKLNPLYGSHPPTHIDLSKVNYKDFQVSMLSSVHDELDFSIREDKFDKIIPELYLIMQIKDVIKSFGVNFDLELDVEYDSNRAFTSSLMYPASKIFLLIKLNSSVNSEETELNTLMLKFEDITPELLDQLDNFNFDSIAPSDKLWALGVQTEDQIYFHGATFPENLFKDLKGKYQKVHIAGM